MATRKRRLIETAIERVGVRRAYTVTLFIASWGLYMRQEGRAPSNCDELAEWWGIHRATAYRDLRVFREAFPHLDYPTEIVLWIEAEDADVFAGSDPAVVAFRVGAAL